MDRRDFLKVSASLAILPIPVVPQLKMYTNSLDWVIAESIEEAKEICQSLSVYIDPEGYYDWGIVSNDLNFDFHLDDGEIESKKIGEFILEHGKGYFACSDY